MKKFMKHSMAMMMAVVMFILIIRVPAKADVLWADWGGGDDVFAQGQKAQFDIDISAVYDYQQLVIDVYNSYGTKVTTSELDSEYVASYKGGVYFTSLEWGSNGWDPGTYTLKWYIKYWSNSAWHSSAYLGSHAIKLVSSSTYGWISHNGFWHYRNPNGYFAFGAQYIDGYWYYFQDGYYQYGRMATSDFFYDDNMDSMIYVGADGRGCSQWVSLDDGDWLYFDSTGWAANGWVKSGGSWYYIEDGWMLHNSWISGSGENSWCYLKDNGVMATGWLSMEDGWHLFGSDGYEKHGWAQDGGKWYFFTASGYMLTGWQQIAGKWYYFGNAMATGWKQIGGTWYYFGSDGAMKTNWQKVDGSWYYFGSDGAMRSGWQKIDGVWYYFNNTMATGWKQIGGTWYYFQSSGAMVSGGSYYIDGRYYTFSSNGAWTGK